MSTTTVEELKDHALRLSRTARAYLAEVLIESLDEDEDFAVPPIAMAEIERRAADMDAGRATMISGDEFVRWLRTPTK